MSLRTRGAVVCAAALLAVLGGCGDGNVHIDSPDVDAHDRSVCRRFLDQVPDHLADQERRTVGPTDALGAAWGDPAITVTCGVPVPEAFNRFSSCEVANGVGWFVPPEQLEDQSSDVTITAVGYRPVVRVDLPADYRPAGAAAVMAELAGLVSKSLTLVQRCR